MHIATLRWGVWPFPAKPLESIDHHRNAKSQTRWPYLMADYWCLRTCFFNMSLHLQMYLYVHTWESICICKYIHISVCVFHRVSTLIQKLPLFPGPWSWWSKRSWSSQGSFQVFLGDVFLSLLRFAASDAPWRWLAMRILEESRGAWTRHRSLVLLASGSVEFKRDGLSCYISLPDINLLHMEILG